MKRSVLFISALCVCLASAAPVFADDRGASSGLLGFYDSELIKVSFQTFGGLTLQAQGQSSSIAMGVSGDIAAMLSRYPESKALLEGYRSKNRIGNTLLWGGLAAVLAGVYYPLFSTDSSEWGTVGYSDSTMRVSVGLMLGGLAGELIGAFILPSSYQDLLNSVNVYNRRAVKEFGQP